MRKIRIITVGKIKKSHWKDAAAAYYKNLKRHIPVQEVIVKDAPGHLRPEEMKCKEGERILAKLTPADNPISLDEFGKTMTSPALAKKLTTWTNDTATAPCFIIGGAFGLSQQVLTRCRFSLSLSPMTFPHELARVLLLEQLYRAITITKNMPYHHH